MGDVKKKHLFPTFKRECIVDTLELLRGMWFNGPIEYIILL